MKIRFEDLLAPDFAISRASWSAQHNQGVLVQMVKFEILHDLQTTRPQ